MAEMWRVESSGIIKHGSKTDQAVASATASGDDPRRARSLWAPATSLHVRVADRPALHLRMASNRIAVMGGEQAAKVMTIVTGKSSNARASRLIQARQDTEKGIIARMEGEFTALYDDCPLGCGINDPSASCDTAQCCVSWSTAAERTGSKPACLC